MATVTTITTVGYGDLSPQTLAGQISTILLLYLLGIALLAQVVGEYIDYRIETREKMAQGRWRWKKMKDHILILNTPSTDRVTYLERLIQQIRNTPGLCEHPVQLLTPSFSDGLPESLKLLGVVHHTALPESSEALINVNLDKAAYVLVLAEDAHDRRSDSCTLDILDHIKRQHVDAYVVAECVHDNNKSRFMQVRADSVLRPVRAYPELLVRALAAPGTEQILENLFTYQGVHAHRFDVSLSGLSWGEVVEKLIRAGVGTPLGYVQQDNKVVTNPGVSEQVKGKAVIVMVNQAYKSNEDIVNEALSC
ncbi:MAG: two pore domain potassium channel family protein [Pseudomonadales bacterium]|nr:two pore domain potassium channel family protein [Pseudomonadales bacterium]